MIIFKIASDLQQYLQSHQSKDKQIGFVPTMGALHQGHLSLIEQSKSSTDISVCSIFVNPTQFNDKKDFEKYPITIEQDIYLLEKAGCDVLFLPSYQEIYPNKSDTEKKYDLGFIETIFEGAHRPGHFNGVCMVVERLVNIVQPHQLFLGQKDFQQCIVIRKLIAIMNLNVEVIVCPTQREKNGLAMSSRNRRLDEKQIEQASTLYQTFLYIKNNLHKKNAKELITDAKNNLLKSGFSTIDYISLANAETLEPIEIYNEKTPLIILAAAFIDGVRLIDNMLLTK